MEAELLKEFKVDDQITTGCLMPGLDDEEIVWTVNTAVHNGVRKMHGKPDEQFSLVRFNLTWFGVTVGEIEAAGQSDGKVEWRSLK